jgi:ankyrin repeat protein
MATQRLRDIIARGFRVGEIGTYDEIRALLEEGADPNAFMYGCRDNFPLMICYRFYDHRHAADSPAMTDILKTLVLFLRHPLFNVNYADGSTCLVIAACEKYHAAFIERVLGHPRLIVTPEIAFECMQAAILSRGRVMERVRALARSDRIRGNLTIWTRVLFIEMISCLNFEEVEGADQAILFDLLLENANDIINEQRADGGNTALHEVQNVDACRLLLERGANPLICNARGETALETFRNSTTVINTVELPDARRREIITRMLKNAIAPQVYAAMMAVKRRGLDSNSASIVGRFFAAGP